MTGGSDESFGNDEPTQPGRGSVLTNVLRNLRLALHEIDRELEESARNFDSVAEAERVHKLNALAEKMGELGDVGHDTRRALRALADDGYPLLSIIG